MLSLLYHTLLLADVRIYLAGLAYSADGSGFGQQLLSIMASAACLLAASLCANQTSCASILRLPSGDSSSHQQQQQQQRRSKSSLWKATLCYPSCRRVRSRGTTATCALAASVSL